MSKLPGLSELTKKFDGLVDSVKSAVNSVGGTPKAPEGDEVAARFVAVMTEVQNLANQQAEQAKAISAVHSKLNALYKDIQLLKTSTSAKETAQPENKSEENKPS